MSRAIFTLTTSESKRLLAKAIINLREVKMALQGHKVIVAGGTTNAFIAEELLGKKIEKAAYTAGIVTQGVQCITPAEERLAPVVLEKGQQVDKSWLQAVDEFGPNDVFIKGANALDHEGIAGVMVADPFGGTIGKALGIVLARGSKLVIPVGLEKMVPSVKAGMDMAGIGTFDYSLGLSVGLVPIVGGKIITELEALQELFGVKAVALACGGVGGSEGAVTISIDGGEESITEAFKFIKKIKGEAPVSSLKQSCKCATPCDRF